MGTGFEQTPEPLEILRVKIAALGKDARGGVWVFRTVCFERVVLSSPGCLWPGRMDDHEKDPLFHRTEMMNKVVSLLTAYGAALENRDHGKNVIHKLLLEGRLSVEEIRFDSQSDN